MHHSNAQEDVVKMARLGNEVNLNAKLGFTETILKYGCVIL